MGLGGDLSEGAFVINREIQVPLPGRKLVCNPIESFVEGYKWVKRGFGSGKRGLKRSNRCQSVVVYAAAAVRCGACASAHTHAAHRAIFQVSGVTFGSKTGIFRCKMALLGAKLPFSGAKWHF